MKATIMVTDAFVRFRLVAIVPHSRPPQSWELFVMTIEQVADILVSLGFLDSEAAVRLTEASTTITPQLGIDTVPMTDLVALTELVYPDAEPISLEAQQGYALLAKGETTEEALASMGFALKSDGLVQ
ncbi:hypothetical protein [Paracidobacterium acidisoli]|uniref:Uncharacterized protein n=1 Tax=Paracidobacterium acidisoli TaxID=2303751 RepID=A0A372IUM2_9BACT|nr:hypothetical protein [Paracidobacterium acidisoli]MBT9329538.1 hypothetical protein [Paracidobacterium acidisoli]